MKIFFYISCPLFDHVTEQKLGIKNFLLDSSLFYAHSISNSQTQQTKWRD